MPRSAELAWARAPRVQPGLRVREAYGARLACCGCLGPQAVREREQAQHALYTLLYTSYTPRC